VALPQTHTDDLGDRFRIAKWCFGTSILDVYEGRDTQLERDVHLRLLKPLAKRHPEAVARFLEAAKNAAGVLHPNLVAVYDSGWMRGRLCLVTEAPAHRLAESLRPLSPEETRRVARDCLRGLAAAHRADLLHGAIDEQAIFVEADGTAKLGDVGLYAAVASFLPPPRAAAPDDTASSVAGDVRALAATVLKRSDGSDPALDATLRSALAVDPGERLASTDALEAALALPGEAPPPAIPPRPAADTAAMTTVAPEPPAPEPPVPSTPSAPATPPVPRRRPVPRALAAYALAAAAVAGLLVVAWHDTDPPTPGRPASHTHHTADLPPEIPR
jgi:serine/threonine protein kinase